MPVAFDRSVCRDLNETISREWVITNGLGGYAAGTVVGALTRMEHGLLVAALPDVATPQLLLAKIDEEIAFDQRTYYLGTNEYRDGTLNPSGFVHLETFRLEEGFPVFTYRLGGIDGILLEKRIWMVRGYNTTYIQYRVLSRTGHEAANVGVSWPKNNSYYGYSEAAQPSLELKLLPFSAYRAHNQPQYGNNDWHFQVHAYNSEQSVASDIALTKGVVGCTIRAWDGATPYAIYAVGHPDSQATFIPTGVWYWHFLRRHDGAAGRPAMDDLYLPGVIRARLLPGEASTLTIVVTAEEIAGQGLRPSQFEHSFQRCVEEQRSILQPQRYFGEGGVTAYDLHTLPLEAGRDWQEQAGPGQTGPELAGPGLAWPRLARPLQGASSDVGDEEFLRLVVQGANRFLISRRVAPGDGQAGRDSFFFTEPERMPVVIADFYGLTDSTRDALIALPGITLATRRFDVARHMLRNFARYMLQGMLPDRLPQAGYPLQKRDYGSVDTTLWFFYALDHYLRATNDYELLDELFPRLVDSIAWYMRGTYVGIKVDADDGLLLASQAGHALTWMNAFSDGMPVTPRAGKPVEVNALWYHALSLMEEWSQQQQERARAITSLAFYVEQRQRCQESFNRRFWYEVGGYLYDGIDGPGGDDASLRSNQLLALSLRCPVLDKKHWQAVLDVITQQLLTPYGLRTLAPGDAGYQGQLGTEQHEQLRSLHQGSVWPWLMGPYVDALLNSSSTLLAAAQAKERKQIQKDRWLQSLHLLELFRDTFSEGMLGMVGGVYNGDAPHYAGSILTSVTGVGEILRIYNLLAQIDFRQAAEPALSIPGTYSRYLEARQNRYSFQNS